MCDRHFFLMCSDWCQYFSLCNASIHCSLRLRIWQLLVRRGYVAEPYGIVTTRKSCVRPFMKPITCHGYTLTDVCKITVLTLRTYKAGRFTDHYRQHWLQTWRTIAPCRNVLRDNLTDVVMSSCLVSSHYCLQ